MLRFQGWLWIGPDRAGSDMAAAGSLEDLVEVILTTNNRTIALNAIFDVHDRFSSKACQAFQDILENATSSQRCRLILLYFLREHKLCDSLVSTHEPALHDLVNAVEMDVENADDDNPDLNFIRFARSKS